MQIMTFLYICENEGLNVSELAEVCRTTRATASRNSRALEVREAPGSLPPYLGLVRSATSERGARTRRLFLSPAGEACRIRLDRMIAAAHPILLPVGRSTAA